MNIMKRYSKRIRDSIPELIEKSGQKGVIRVLNEEEYKKELLKKLVEEAQEVVETQGDKKELVKELADIMEVVEYIMKVFVIEKGEIENVKKEKKEKRGGFEKRLFLEYIDE